MDWRGAQRSVNGITGTGNLRSLSRLKIVLVEGFLKFYVLTNVI